MKRILCYGDSNTWGYDVETTNRMGVSARFPEDVRWTGVMQQLLGPEYRVLEEGLNGRTTVFDEPGACDKNGNAFLEVAIRTCSPFDLIILMLGTNDLKEVYHASSHVIMRGMERMIRTCRDVLAYTSSSQAKIMIAAPLNVQPAGEGAFMYDFTPNSNRKGEEVRGKYRDLAQRLGCAFFDVNDFVRACPIDGVHLDAASHRVLGETMTAAVRELLSE